MANVTPSNLSQILAIWMVVNLLFVTVWDLCILFLAPSQITVSRYLWDLGHKYPLLYFALGVAIGHIMLPLVVQMGNGHSK